MSYLSSAISSDILLPRTLSVGIQIFVGTLLIALCAQIRIPLFFTPVPLTMQTLAVLLIGCTLGSRKGALSVILYLAASLMSLPVLSGGRIDPFALMSPVGGYLIGLVVQAYISGWFAERQMKLGKSKMFLGLMFACCLQLSIGATWLGFYLGFKHIFFLGVFPFIAGEILKVMAVTALLQKK